MHHCHDITLAVTVALNPNTTNQPTTSLLKTLWGNEKLLVTRTSCHPHQLQSCRLQTLSVRKFIKFVVWERVTDKNVMISKENAHIKSIPFTVCYSKVNFSCLFMVSKFPYKVVMQLFRPIGWT